MSDFSKDPAMLLGKVIDAPEVVAYQKTLDSKAKIKREDGQKLWWSKSAGIEIHSEETQNRITDVFLYGEGVEGYRQYKGITPRGLSFGSMRDSVRRTMKAAPDFSGDGSEPYDTWDAEDYRLVVSYDEDGKVCSLCVSGDF